jgi:hypothetical protein
MFKITHDLWFMSTLKHTHKASQWNYFKNNFVCTFLLFKFIF